jgi:transcriptional regulator with XRE-family HTH domain
MQFSDISRPLRQHLGLRQDEMAERLGISRSYYGELESGKREASKTLLEMIQLLDKVERLNVDSVGNGSVHEEPGEYGRRASKLEKINAHLEPWILKARVDHELAGYLLTQLRLHLPHEQLERLEVAQGGQIQKRSNQPVKRNQRQGEERA